MLAFPATDGEFSILAALGEALFFDADLSANRTQACATCHNPDFGCVDPHTVVLFYNNYNATDMARHVNPETGLHFAPPEVPDTLSLEELEHGPALDDRRIDALVASMKTLTDARYEPLLEDGSRAAGSHTRPVCVDTRCCSEAGSDRVRAGLSGRAMK